MKTTNHNLMMVSVYWRQRYNNSISDTIDLEKLSELNVTLDQVSSLLKISREKLHSIEHNGREHTMGIWSIYQSIDKHMEEIKKIKALCNKTDSQINLADYPIEDLA